MKRTIAQAREKKESKEMTKGRQTERESSAKDGLLYSGNGNYYCTAMPQMDGRALKGQWQIRLLLLPPLINASIETGEHTHTHTFIYVCCATNF